MKFETLKRGLGLRLLVLASAAGLVLLDQLLKQWVQGAMLPLENRPLLPGFLRLHYTQNTGISFSLLSGIPAAMWVISILTGAVMLFVGGLILSGRLQNLAHLWAAALVFAGGTGNLVDRLARGFVVDYLEFEFVRFAVFNLADVLITCAVGVLVVWLIWEEKRTKQRARVATP